MPDPAVSRISAMDVDFAAILQNQPVPVLLINGHGEILYANAASEQFFGAGIAVQMRLGMSGLVKTIPELDGLFRQACLKNETVFGHDVAIAPTRNSNLGQRADIHICPLEDSGAIYLITVMTPYGIPHADRSKNGHYASKQTASMTAVLAHEIKNPLSGIRGAAQLLDRISGEKEKRFTQLIQDEVDRICGLIDRMEDLSENPGNAAMEPVNIHRVLDHVKTLAQAGFARDFRVIENYDPSLPPVKGNKDRLIQLFLNIIKNAAEALEERGDTIRLSTAFRHDVRLIDADKKAFTGRAIEISVADNAGGVPDEFADCLFDPFVTDKQGGVGLGLALVAKIVADHGGSITAVNRDGGAVFTVLLPVFTKTAGTKEENQA